MSKPFPLSAAIITAVDVKRLDTVIVKRRFVIPYRQPEERWCPPKWAIKERGAGYHSHV